MLLTIYVVNPVHIEKNSPIHYNKQKQFAKIIYDLFNFKTIYETDITEYQLE